jgi:Peptidase_C39 like family
MRTSALHRTSVPVWLLVLVVALVAFAREGSAQIQLTSGVPYGGLWGNTGDAKLFVLAVPQGSSSVVVETVCGDPDADIYLRWGAPPTPYVWNHKSDGPSSNESITLIDPPSGLLYILLRANTSYVGLGIVGYCFGGDDIDLIELENGDSIDGLNGYAGESIYFKLSIPFDQDYVDIQLVGGDPDADLYARWGALPSTNIYDAASTSSSSHEGITITNPGSGDLYVLVHAYSTYFNATLFVEWDGPCVGCEPLELTNGASTNSFGGYQGSLKLFAIEIPDETTNVTFEMWGGWGDADLYIRWNEAPTLDEWDYSQYLEGNNESVTVWYPEAGTAYLLVHGYDDYGGVRLRATYQAWTHFSQLTGPWKNDKIGSSSNKMKNDGSVITSLAMALAFAGADVDPGSLNAWLKANNGFTDGSTVKWKTAAAYDGPQGIDYLGPNKITTMAKLRQTLDQGRIVLARSNRYDNNSHWVVIRHYTGNGNSWSKFHYWDPADPVAIDRTMGDGWVKTGAKTRVYSISE